MEQAGKASVKATWRQAEKEAAAMTKKFGKANQKSWKSILNTREQMKKETESEQDKTEVQPAQAESEIQPRKAPVVIAAEEAGPELKLEAADALNLDCEQPAVVNEEIMSGMPEDSEAPAKLNKEEEKNPMECKDKKTMITSDIKITGDLEGDADLEFHGKITGNIITGGTVVLDGQIDGSIQAMALSLDGGTVRGDILCEKTIEILPDSEIVGNLQAEVVTVNGHIRGDLYCGGMLTLLDHSVVEGNITTESISVHEGALIEGQLSMEKK